MKNGKKHQGMTVVVARFEALISTSDDSVECPVCWQDLETANWICTVINAIPGTIFSAQM